MNPLLHGSERFTRRSVNLSVRFWPPPEGAQVNGPVLVDRWFADPVWCASTGRARPRGAVCGSVATMRDEPEAPVAQLDRAPGFEPGGRGFESLPARHSNLGGVNDLRVGDACVRLASMVL